MQQMMIHIERPLPGAVTIVLNRPEKRNALNIALLEDLFNTITEFNLDHSIRVMILKGNGPLFCTGLDLSEATDPSKSKYSGELVKMTFEAIYNSPHTTIATVHGAAIAGGAGLMCACDFAFAAEGTKFGFPEVHRGLVPALILPLLSRQLGQGKVKELLLLGETIDTDKALALGLIHRIAPADQLSDQAHAIAKQIMKGAPEALAETKKLIHALYPSEFEKDLNTALEVHDKIRHSTEAREGAHAFLEKRLPSWGR